MRTLFFLRIFRTRMEIVDQPPLYNAYSYIVKLRNPFQGLGCGNSTLRICRALMQTAAQAPHMRWLTMPRRNGRSPLDPPRPCADVRVKQPFRKYALILCAHISAEPPTPSQLGSVGSGFSTMRISQVLAYIIA